MVKSFVLSGVTQIGRAVALNGDAQIAVSASADKTLKVWEVRSGKPLRALEAHSAGVWSVALSGDGQTAVSASDDGTLRVWDIDTGRQLLPFLRHPGHVHSVALSADGRIAVSASSDQTLKVWDIGIGQLLTTFTCEAGVWSCACSWDCRMIIAGDEGGYIHFLRLEEPKRATDWRASGE